MKSVITAPVRPAPMDNTRINTPGEYRAWQDAERAYFDALRSIEQAKQDAVEQAKAEASRLLTTQEYYIMACQRENENKAKEAARVAAQKDAEQAEADRLASSPEVAQISHRSEYMLLLEVVHWAKKGYEINEHSVQIFQPGFYNVTMSAPAAPAAKGAK